MKSIQRARHYTRRQLTLTPNQNKNKRHYSIFLLWFSIITKWLQNIISLSSSGACFLNSFRFISGRWEKARAAKFTSATDFHHEAICSTMTSSTRVVMSTEESCQANCSGHGECMNGSCYCLIQFEGDECQRIHFSYHVAFSSIFFLLALTSLIQLVMCIHAEYLRMKKNPSIIKACRVTTQKFLYFLVFLAAVLRGAYFAAPVSTTIISCLRVAQPWAVQYLS